MGAIDHNPFRSFWMGGFEGADHVNSHGIGLDMATSTGHVERIEEDHAQAAALGLKTLRESIGWRLAEPIPGRFDLDRARRIALSAERHGVQVLWTLMHYGTPRDVSLLDDAFVPRFAAFAGAVAAAVGALSGAPPVYTLVNEIGFVAWAVSQTNLIHPYCGDPFGEGGRTLESGFAVKRRLVQAVLAGIDAIRRVDPRARFLHVEPLVHVVAPPGRPDLEPLAQQVAGYQWQAWDMLAGRLEPELGGSPSQLDLIGANHYHSGQWQLSADGAVEARLEWHLRDPRRRRPASLLRDAWQRYERPLIVAETSHIGEGRSAWLDDMACEVRQARHDGTPVAGLCLYPLIDRHDWDDARHWHHSGLFDLRLHADDGRRLDRRLHAGYARTLARWQAVLPQPPAGAPGLAGPPPILVLSQRRWDTVLPRLQRLLLRLADDQRVLFVQAPAGGLHGSGPPWLDRVAQSPGLDVLMLQGAADLRGAGTLASLLRAYLQAERIGDFTAWCCVPDLLGLADGLRPALVVCDALDPRDAAEWQAQQGAVAADVFFTGGATTRVPVAGRRVCLPAAVDAHRFGAGVLQAASAEADHAERLQRAIPRPRLGVVVGAEAAVDRGLLDALARARGDWQIVLVGETGWPAEPPANLHRLGRQTEDVVPHLMAGWDAVLVPLSTGDCRSLVDQPQWLDGLAAARPVLASAQPHGWAGLDGNAVVAVDVSQGLPAWLAAVDAVLAESPAQRALRLQAAAAQVRARSLQAVARTVQSTLHAARLARRAPTPAAPSGPPTGPPAW